MAACAPLLDEELSSFVFNYLTENSGSQYGEEEVCSDRLDFPDIDLSQLDTSDFDSDNCLNELQWCNDQTTGTSPTSIHYSTTDELFEIEEEHAALLAALTDSLDGMGGLSVFPSLEEEPKADAEKEDGLALCPEDLSHLMGAHTEDSSLLKQLLQTPPNVPTGSDLHKDGVRTHRYSNRGSHLRQVRPLVKTDLERKPRAVRPAGRLCTELHRHLTTSRDSADVRNAETEEDEEDSESEMDDDDDDEEEEEEESSSSEVEASTAPVEPLKPQYSSEKELRSVVELITYMHTYCLPMRKQQGWERKDREMQRQRARPETSRPASTNTRVVLVGNPRPCVGATTSSVPRRLPFARRREQKADSLLCELLQQSNSYDVSKPYRLHSPPYVQPHRPSRLSAPTTSSSTKYTPSSASPKPELRHDSPSPKRRADSPEMFLDTPEDFGSFSVRRSRRLATFPSRFAKRLRPSRPREVKEEGDEAYAGVQVLPNHAVDGATTLAEKLAMTEDGAEKSCGHNEKRSCLCLPLNPKTTGESQFSSKSFEQTLGVDLCGTAGLTPPTTPPHKPVEDELFKPAEGGKSGGVSGVDGGGGGGETVLPSSHVSASRSWLSRASHQRKLPEQTELYAQLRRMGQAGEAEACRSFGDHNYCALSLSESRRRSAAILGAILKAQGGGGGRERPGTPEPKLADQVPAAETCEENLDALVASSMAELEEEQTVIAELLTDCQLMASTPPTSEEEAERSSGSRSPSPVHICPDFPASKTDSSERSEIFSDDKLSHKDMSDQDDCQLFYIHNLPSSMTQNKLKKRFQVFGKAEDCKVIICNEERCGVIKIRQSGLQRHWRDRDIIPGGQRRLSRKRYIDLDEAGPGPVKSKYDALDFDTLLKEAQKSLHR